MSIFFELPDDLCRLVCNEWICSTSLSFLDTAVCSSKYRTRFIAAILPFVEGVCPKDSDNELLVWLTSKNIKLRELFLPETIPELWATPLQKQWENVTKLHVERTRDLDLKNCRSLLSLNCNDTDPELLFVNETFLSQLTCLDISSYYDNAFSMSSLLAIHKHCRSLQSFKYIFPPNVETNGLLLDILRLNTQLRSVSLYCDDELLEGLSRYCPALVSITVTNKLDVATMEYVLQKFDRIECVHLRNRYCYINYERFNNKLDLSLDNYEDWSEFFDQLPYLREINFGTIANYTLVDALYRHLQTLSCLTVRSGDYFNVLLYLLQECMALKTFSFDAYSRWSHKPFPPSIEQITIVGEVNLNECTHFLLRCRRLKWLNFGYVSLPRGSLEEFQQFLTEFQQCRHSVTGLPLRGSISARGGKKGRYKVYLEMQGKVISVWDDRCRRKDVKTSSRVKKIIHKIKIMKFLFSKNKDRLLE